MLKLLVSTDVTGVIPVELFETSHGYAVRYGLQVSRRDTLDDAIKLHGEYMIHALGIAGVFEDDEDWDE